MIANEFFGAMTTPEQSHIGDRLRGIVLDLDGLLVDSELWSWQAHDAALQSYGHEPLSVDEVRRLIGLVRIDEWTELSKMRVLDVDRPESDFRHRVAFVEARVC
jgi:phosphoglycolate phosphatase-like HAD superfamily hydrolase